MRLIASLLLACALLPLGAAAEGIIFITRHAEKSAEGKDPELTPAGRARAQNIAAILAATGVKAVYTTKYARTRQTGEALAQTLGLPVQEYSADKPQSMVEQVKAAGGNALVVGHSNTVPELVRAFGGAPGADIPDTEYNRLYQLIIDKEGKVTTVLLKSLP